MQDEHSAIIEYEKFVRDIHESKTIWGLQHASGGWAKCLSNQFEETFVMVFWSTRAQAEQHKIDAWSEYEATSIVASEFIGSWLKRLHNEGSIVIGVNWNTELSGLEVEAEELAAKLMLGNV